MPQIRSEQLRNLTLTDLQVADDANIQQHKIENWESDAAGWISKGIIKPVTTAELPIWDGSQAGQFFYDTNTNEIFIGITTPPYYALIAGDGGTTTGDTALKDRIIVVKSSIESENWTGATDTDMNGTSSIYSLDTDKVTGDGSNLLVYLNGVLQERGAGSDYSLYEEGGVDKIQFTYNLEGPDQKVTAIVSVDEYLVNYATKAYVDNILMDGTSHDHNGSGSPQLDINESMTTASMNALIRNMIPAADDTIDLGSATNRFANLYAKEGHFDANTIYIGGVALSSAGDTLSISKDGGTTFNEVAVSGLTDVPAQLAAGAGQPIILESDSGITAKGDILPDMVGATNEVSTRNIGSPTQKFDSVYADEVFIGAHSLYVNGKKVIEDNSDEMTFATDLDQAMAIKTASTTPGTGNGNLTLTAGNELNAVANGGMEWTVSGAATKHMNFSNESVGGNITLTSTGTSSQIQLNAADEIDLTAPTIEVNGNVNIDGDLVVTGTTTTVNSETVTMADNILLLNSNATGTPTQDSGIEIERGDELNYRFVFEESEDTFKVGEVGSLQAVATREDSPTANGITIWDSGTDKLITNTDLKYNNGTLTTTTVAANLTGNVTGNLTGNVTGDVTGDVTGNADTATTATTATKLATPRTITLAGDLTGNVSFDGSGDVSLNSVVDAVNIKVGGIELKDTAIRSGLLELNRYGATDWSGTSINFSATAKWSMMGNETNFGAYDEVGSKWIWQHTKNGEFEARHNNVTRIATTATGVDVTGDLTVGNIDSSGGISLAGGVSGGLQIENGYHTITSNDGGGNFNIRVANKFSNSSHTITEDGYASHWVFNQITGSWTFNASSTSQLVDDVADFSTVLLFDPDSILLNKDTTVSGELTINKGIVVTTNTQVYQAGSLGYTDSSWGFINRPPRVGTSGAHLFTTFADDHILTLKEDLTSMFGGDVTVGGQIIIDQTGSGVQDGLRITNGNAGFYFWVDENDLRKIDSSAAGSTPMSLNGTGGGEILINTEVNDGENSLQVGGSAKITGQTVIENTTNGTVGLKVIQNHDDPNNTPSLIVTSDGEVDDVIMELRANASGTTVDTSDTPNSDDAVFIVDGTGNVETKGDITSNDRHVTTACAQSTFPTTNIGVGDECFRTDLNKFFKYTGATWIQI